jgi:hypothetical protein
MASDRNDEDRTPAEEEFILAIETGPLAEVEIVETDDGEHVDLSVNAVSVDPDTGEAVPVSISLNPDDSAFVVTVADEEFVVPLEETSDESSDETSDRRAGQIGPLRKLQELATRVEQQAKGKAKELAEKFKRNRSSGESRSSGATTR